MTPNWAAPEILRSLVVKDDHEKLWQGITNKKKGKTGKASSTRKHVSSECARSHRQEKSAKYEDQGYFLTEDSEDDQKKGKDAVDAKHSTSDNKYDSDGSNDDNHNSSKYCDDK